MHATRRWPSSCSFAYGCILAPFEHFCWREMQKRTRTAPAPVSEPAAPRCDVTASQPTLSKPGPTARFHFLCRTGIRITTGFVSGHRFSDAANSRKSDAPLGAGHRQSPAVPSRNPLPSSSSATNPSGNRGRLYSAMRFFHLRKSVMLSGSIRISTLRKLASKRFISF